MNGQVYIRKDPDVSFVCAACSNGDHSECRGGTWCDCAHVSPRMRGLLDVLHGAAVDIKAGRKTVAER